MFNKMRTRGYRLEPIAEILRLSGDVPFAKFHDAHRVRGYPVIAKDEFNYPEIASAENPPHRETLLVWLQETTFSDILSAMDPLARLRIIKHGVLSVDFVLNLEITSVRSIGAAGPPAWLPLQPPVCATQL